MNMTLFLIVWYLTGFVSVTLYIRYHFGQFLVRDLQAGFLLGFFGFITTISMIVILIFDLIEKWDKKKKIGDKKLF